MQENNEWRGLFHPTVWRYFERTYGVPTPIQEKAWRTLNAIFSGKDSTARHALILAATGQGKTLAAFLAIINSLVCRAIAGENIQLAKILYISPLKALAHDMEKNLRQPLAEITAELQKDGIVIPEIRALVRTGDSTAGERRRLFASPPQIVVTTPESLFLLLTSQKGRELLAPVEIVVVDEIHALAGNRRGAHLSLSLARLEALHRDYCTARGIEYRKLSRIGISATVRPAERVAFFLAGEEPMALCEDRSVRPMEIRMLLPQEGLGTVMSGRNWEEIYAALAQEISTRRTTLIFANNRRLCERLAHALGLILGSEQIATHHSSLAYAERRRSEMMLKEGRLRVMIATSSLELGIDIGTVDLVVQISSPRSIHAFVQRAGRAEHRKDGVSRVILIPLSRDDLRECVALVRALRHGILEETKLATAALDVLAQHVVAEVAARSITEDELFSMLTAAPIYRTLARQKFHKILNMLDEGYHPRFGQKRRYIFYDPTDRTLHARPGAKLAALLNAGAIPENFEYEVIDTENGICVGSVGEDFALESLRGDVFILGNRKWQIQQVVGNRMLVSPAPDKYPTIPLWIVDVPGRSDALSAAVAELNLRFLSAASPQQFVQELVAETGLPKQAIAILAEYLHRSHMALGVLPHHRQIVFERFFDETGSCHIVLHSPFGTQIHRAWGYALRKRLCRKFNFELQAAASDDALILSFSLAHSFPLEEIARYLHSQSVLEFLRQAILATPLWEIRWRWVASRALAVPRRGLAGRVPTQWQRSQAQDLLALVFPDQLACAENLSGERTIPDHPLVEQTLEDCLEEAMDCQGLVAILQKIEKGEIQTSFVESNEPSLLAYEIINARPYAFLDDAPIEERRSRAVRTGLFSETAGISDAAMAAIADEAFYPRTNFEELQDLLVQLAVFPESLLMRIASPDLLALFFTRGKIALFEQQLLPERFYYSVARAALVEKAFAENPSSGAKESDEALDRIVLAQLEFYGPITVSAMAQKIPIGHDALFSSMLRLENSGSVFRFEKNGELFFCERYLYHRLRRHHRKTLSAQKPVSAQQFLSFVVAWQHAAPGYGLSGENALGEILHQLAGVALSSDGWSFALARRIAHFREEDLERLLLTGEFFWFHPPRPKGRTITEKTRFMLLPRALWPDLAPTMNSEGLCADAQRIAQYLKTHGASFLSEVHASGKFFTEQTLRGIRELIARGLVSSDQFFALRRLWQPRRFAPPFPAGRFFLLLPPNTEGQKARRVAEMLLQRFGIVFRHAAELDYFRLPWPELVRELRRLEMAGIVRTGYFIEGLWGEQFALPQALELLYTVPKALQPEPQDPSY
ncbi:MAG: DEAD/DEAH box helicase, partial [Turneriella sp.]|nr:DEAD/DEAH box helicase [Turneriella sp.]